MFHYPARTRLFYQTRALTKDYSKQHNPLAGKHLGELPVHSTKKTYGMVCLTFTKLFKQNAKTANFISRQNLRAKEFINVGFQ